MAITGIERNPARPSVWRLPGFRRLWAGSTVSWFGSEVGELALPLLAILTLGATQVEVGALRAAQLLPFLVATLPLGVVVDRGRRRRMMVGADAARFVLIGAIPVAVWAGVARIELLCVLVFAAGVLTVLYQLADFAFLPGLVGKGRLVDANARLAASQSATEIGGKGLGGLLVDVLSAPVAVLADALSYLASALLLSGVPDADPPAREPAASRSRRQETLEGLRLVFANRYVRPLLGEATTFNLCNEVFVIGLLLYTARDLGLDGFAIGMIFTAGGAGSFLGAALGTRLTRRFGYGAALLATLVAGNSAPLAVLAVTGPGAPTLPVFLATFAVMGFGIALANVHGVSLRQAAVAERLHGRVNAAYRLLSWGAIPVGATIGGLLAAAVGNRSAMVIGAAGIPLATLWVAASPVRSLASIDEAAERA
jgi:MFS family permease